MTSESSSAVLEMNDADTDDTEATTVTDDAHEGTPLIMEHGFDIAVKVDAPMKQLSTLETYVTYRVRCVCARWRTPPYVRRRYNHFKALHKRLSACHPWLAPPPLPPLHSARQQLDRYSASFVAVRTLAIDAFLDRVAKHPILTHSEDFRLFLTTPDDEFDKVFKNESTALNLWGLSTAFYGSSDAKTANGPRVKDPEFTSVSDYLQSLEQKLTVLCALTTKLHKGTVGVSTELISMKRVCDAWASGAGGRVCAGAGAVGAGAGCAAGAGGRARPPHAPRARLPLLAAYARAHRDKIHARDQLHAAYVSGSSATDDVHNRVSQASEALRSELSDWMPKTRSEIKSLLVQLAERQVNLHTQTLYGWEQALKLATEQNISQIFKTVSKNAVQNLSPTKCRSDITITETGDIESEFDDDSKEIDDKLVDDDDEKFVNIDIEVKEFDVQDLDNMTYHNEKTNTVKNDDTSDVKTNLSHDKTDFSDGKTDLVDLDADKKSDLNVIEDLGHSNDSKRNYDDIRPLKDDRQASYLNSKDFEVKYQEEIDNNDKNDDDPTNISTEILNNTVSNDESIDKTNLETKIHSEIDKPNHIVNENCFKHENNDLNSDSKPNNVENDQSDEKANILDVSEKENVVNSSENDIKDPLTSFTEVELS